jgi:translation initiation factor IF-3
MQPVCRLVDYGKYRYEQAKKDKESRKHQHANKVKEIQLSPQIDPHDFGVKLSHAIDFLCEDIKVKVTLRFRGREMAHKEFGFQQIEKFTREVAPYGHPDFEAKLVGKGITVMFSPLPRNKRAKHPHGEAGAHPAPEQPHAKPAGANSEGKPVQIKHGSGMAPKQSPAPFSNNPFAKLDLKPRQESSETSGAES